MQSNSDFAWAFISGLIVVAFWVASIGMILGRLREIRDELRRINARHTPKDKWGEPTE